uniref:MATH domain-containing protein n=1 Tax=Panagrolaimus sp. ES5 TaxID=591445 RepID=A0AC34G6G5_9BILA
MFDWLSYKWSVPVNSFYKEYLISPQFSSSKNDEAKFRLKICPSGSKKRDYFSLFVICDSKETSFKAKISATLLNINQRNHYGLGWFLSNDSLMETNFIKIDDLMDREQGFIKNEFIEIWCVIGFTPEPRPRLVYVQHEDEEISMDCEDYECYFEYGDGNLDGCEREALIVADALQMVDLKEFCETRLAKMVVYGNLKKFTNLAVKYNAALILEKCLILRNRLDSKCHFVI